MLLTASVVTIPAGTNAVAIAVVPIDDAEEEFEEDVKISLTAVSGGQIGGSFSATVYITDNDGALQFQSATMTANENVGVVSINVVRSGSSTNGVVTVDYVISNVTATNGVDYFGTNGTLTFVAGQVFTNFSITISNNAIVDGNRVIGLALANPTGGLPLGGQSTATLTILDDDTAFQFAAANFVTTEISTNGFVTVYRLGVNTGTA